MKNENKAETREEAAAGRSSSGASDSRYAASLEWFMRNGLAVTGRENPEGREEGHNAGIPGAA